MNNIKNKKTTAINLIIWRKIFIFACLLVLFAPSLCWAMPPGALVYRTSGGGKMYGYSGDPLIYEEKGVVKNVYSGHVGIYIGQEDGVDYIVEALMGGVVKTPAKNFVNSAEGEKYLGAKIPKNLTAVQQAKVVAIAKSLVDKKLAYDFDFKAQKGPKSGEWTCVGLTEKIYESANISNPNNLESLEYDPNYYALDITPDGFDDYSAVNSLGDCFSREYEFSKIARRTNLLIPAPELIGYDLGLENEGERYIFLPYTQFLQKNLSNVATDIVVASEFSGSEIRGRVPVVALVLRWSLINNPLSSFKNIAKKTKEAILSISNMIFGGDSSNTGSGIVLTNVNEDRLNQVEAARDLVIVNKVDPSKKNKTLGNKSSAAKKSSAKSLNKVEAQSGAVKVNRATSTKLQEPPSNKSSSSSSIVKGASTKLSTSTSEKTQRTKTTKTLNTNKASSTPLLYYNPTTSNLTTSSGGVSLVSTDNFPKIATINKIYSTGNNNWIELYNTTDRDFDLKTAEYRLEKAKTAEDPSLIMRLGNADDGSYPGGTIIKAHSSYLIVKSTANDYYLSRADAIATRDDFSWPSSGYTLYLGTGAISSNTDSDIIEAIGFGSDATYFQGEGPAPAIKEGYILNRIKNNGNNKADFNLIKSNDSSIDWAAIEEASTSTQGAATSTNNMNQSHLALISKIYGTGYNNWIELYNTTEFDFDLASSSYRLEKTKTAEDSSLMMRIGDPADGFYPGGTVIKAKNKYLIVRDETNDFYKMKADAIATRTEFSWFDSGYTIYLGNGPISSSTDENIVDLVGYGADATYWQGLAPAPSLVDNYILNRVATSGNNNFDFNLLAADDPDIDWSSGGGAGTSSNIYNFSASSYSLFVQPNPLDLPGLIHLWHFDECFGSAAEDAVGSTTLSATDYWLPGKFSCAKNVGYNFGSLNGIFNEEVDINNFSLSFWFKANQAFPRLSLTLSNNDNESINITLEQGLMQFSGLPNPDWRYFCDFPMDNIWRQGTLVVNRNEGYWSFYVDGVERFHQHSYKLFAPINKIEVGGDNGPYSIDELAIWNRALSADEIINLRNSESPLSPLELIVPQKIPILKHFWNFNEGIGTTSLDLVGAASLVVDKNAWLNLDLTNSALLLEMNKGIKVNFPVLNSPDLSLTFWWRSPSIYDSNRAHVGLCNEAQSNILSLIPSQYFSGYNFNGFYGYFSEGLNLAIPQDTSWHHLALVYDSYRYLLRFYVDGIEKGNQSFLWPAYRPLADSLEIYAENWNSEIDDLAVWEGALSGMQIQEIFTNN